MAIKSLDYGWLATSCMLLQLSCWPTDPTASESTGCIPACQRVHKRLTSLFRTHDQPAHLRLLFAVSLSASRGKDGVLLGSRTNWSLFLMHRSESTVLFSPIPLFLIFLILSVAFPYHIHCSAGRCWAGWEGICRVRPFSITGEVEI